MHLNTTSDQASKEFPGILSVLEKAEQSKTFPRLVVFAIYLEIYLNLTGKGPLYKLSWESLTTEHTIGEILLFAASYAFFIKYLSPVLQSIAERLLFEIASWAPKFLTNWMFGRKNEPPRYHLHAYELLRAAANDNNSPYFQLYQQHQERQSQKLAAHAARTSYSFALLLLITVDCLVVKDGSIIRYAIVGLEGFREGVGILVGFMMFCCLVYGWLGYTYLQENWVLCPSLYQKLENERQERRRKEQELLYKHR